MKRSKKRAGDKGGGMAAPAGATIGLCCQMTTDFDLEVDLAV